MEKTPLKTIVIVGPTASGKSDLAILVAKKYDGEIISADSRQVYRGMDIGSGKVVRDKTTMYHINDDRQLYDTEGILKKQVRQRKNMYLSEGIVHHLIDVASPKRTYNVTHFVRDAKKALADIRKRGKVPIICGGTGFWVQALLEDASFPAVKPDKKLRSTLDAKSTTELFAMLAKRDPARAKTIDLHNKVRLIRALEIVAALGAVPPAEKNQELRTENEKTIVIALVPEKEILYTRIEKRLEKRLSQGMLEEVKRLRTSGVSWKRLEIFGLEYRWCAKLLQKNISQQELEIGLPNDIRHYAKRQITWLKRLEKMGTSLSWITDPKDAASILEKKLK